MLLLFSDYPLFTLLIFSIVCFPFCSFLQLTLLLFYFYFWGAYIARLFCLLKLDALFINFELFLSSHTNIKAINISVGTQLAIPYSFDIRTFVVT